MTGVRRPLIFRPSAPIAQVVEQLTFNQWVPGSSPGGRTSPPLRSAPFRRPAAPNGRLDKVQRRSARNLRRCFRFAAFAAIAVSFSSANAEQVFVKAAAPLDEPRGLCLDIPGHRSRVNIDAPLGVHTCKWGLWNFDERFDGDALAKGELRMPEYGLCVGVSAPAEGTKILLTDCDGPALRRWTFSDGRLRLAAAPDMCLTIGAGPSRLTPGGRRLASRHVARSLALEACRDSAKARQTWETVAPDTQGKAGE